MMFKLLLGSDGILKVKSPEKKEITLDEKVHIFRYNPASQELHVLIRKKHDEVAFYKVSEWINSKKKWRFKDEKTGKLPTSVEEAIVLSLNDAAAYNVIGCTTLKEALSIMKEYGI